MTCYFNGSEKHLELLLLILALYQSSWTQSPTLPLSLQR